MIQNAEKKICTAALNFKEMGEHVGHGFTYKNII